MIRNSSSIEIEDNTLDRYRNIIQDSHDYIELLFD